MRKWHTSPYWRRLTQYTKNVHPNDQMNRKYLIAGLVGFAAIIGWNIFLVHRDDEMYDAYYRHKAVEILKNRPSSEIDYSTQESFCQSQGKRYCNFQ